MTSSDIPAYAQRRERLISEMAAARAHGASIGLAKSTSNLFRHRVQTDTKRIDVRSFHHVLHIDTSSRIADVEGMTTYEELADETLKHGLLPTVVPQLKTITIGGAISGIGIESSSFKFGLVHETVEEMEILLGDGSTITCSATQNSDLFYGFPNSYGTLGYVLRLKVKLIPTKEYVKLTHTKFTEPAKFFAQIEASCASSRFDYIDGAVFDGSEMYITTGEFTDDAPFVSDYTYMKVFYQSIRQREEDYLTAKNYIWRWDTDWFWCSKHFYVQHAPVRLLATRWLLNSKTYQRIMRLSHKIMPDSNTESVIQDVDIPIEHTVEFLDFLLREIGVLPIPQLRSQRHLRSLCARSQEALHQLWLLGHRPEHATGRTLQQENRSEGVGVARQERSVLDCLFRRADLLANLQSSRVRSAEEQVRSESLLQGLVRENGEAAVREPYGS